MNTLTAAELKRRGMAAIEEGLRRGPLHLLKRNKAAAVVMSAKEFDRLTRVNRAVVPGMTAMEWLRRQPRTGTKTKEEIDRGLDVDRGTWR